jgi:alpha-amylase
VLNHESAALSRSFDTGLPPGSYCDVIAGGLSAGSCLGATVTVDAGGMAMIDVPAMTALAIHVAQKK